VAILGPRTISRDDRAALLITVTLPALSAAGLTVRDQTGRSLTLPAPPRRIVSLVPSVTEILFAIGAQDVLVGVTDFCDYPPEARKKQSVGGMVAPSLETIVALKPDLVVATSAGNGEAVFTQLDRLKIAVYVVNPTRLDDVFDLIARLGALTGREAEATRLSARLSATRQGRRGARRGRCRGPACSTSCGRTRSSCPRGGRSSRSCSSWPVPCRSRPRVGTGIHAIASRPPSPARPR
jgi:iron complex transport system substrate-binding protein